MGIINEVKGIPLGQLREAFEAGGAELNIGARTILVDPGVPASGMTLFGENGFVVAERLLPQTRNSPRLYFTRPIG